MGIIAAYWDHDSGPRDVESAARGLQATLDRIDASLPGQGWFSPGDPDNPTAAGDLGRALEAGIMTSDNGIAMPELGYSLSVWNGEKSRDASIGVSLATGGTAPTWVGSCVLQLADDAVGAEQARQLLGHLVVTWSPRWAIWTTNAIRRSGWRDGVPKTSPQRGRLVWVRDGVDDPFVDDAGTALHGGILHDFVERFA